jgi:hypothetical protein
VSVDVVEERHVLPQRQVHVGWNDNWQVMWSHVARPTVSPMKLCKILEIV